ncbi:MAG: amidohydrolase [Pseudobdellovibrionaceae bacterium]|jgi:predicted amidohydrolase YtcJ
MLKIERCYDSHLHLEATGQIDLTLNLSHLRNLTDLKALQFSTVDFRGEWLTGFGWDQNNFLDLQLHHKTLDLISQKFPISFSRADGHCAWVNSLALDLLLQQDLTAKEKDQILRDRDGNPTGVLLDAAKERLEKLIPSYSKEIRRKFILRGQEILNRAGFTHVRDMTWDQTQIEILHELEQEGLLTLFVEGYILLSHHQDLGEKLNLARRTRQISSRQVRLLGIKLFYDGALGSEGALLSQNYHGKHHCGVRLWEPDSFRQSLKEIWTAGFEIATHTIGDQALQDVAEMALQARPQGVFAPLCFEHAEVVQDKSFQLLQELSAKLYFQPCHYLSDRKWLKEKLGPLFSLAFPWRKAEESAIPFYFGSDTPIEKPDLFANVRALEAAAQEGIRPPLGSWVKFHQHPDASWGSKCWTELNEQKVSQVYFQGEPLF